MSAKTSALERRVSQGIAARERGHGSSPAAIARITRFRKALLGDRRRAKAGIGKRARGYEWRGLGGKLPLRDTNVATEKIALLCGVIFAVMSKLMDDQALMNLFLSHLIESVERLRGGARLVHYTSAENAYKIISGKQVWLRNAHLMND